MVKLCNGFSNKMPTAPVTHVNRKPTAFATTRELTPEELTAAPIR